MSVSDITTSNEEAEVRENLKLLTNRNFVQRMVDSLFGYDFFISYRWRDGSEYALSLAQKLKAKGYNSFLDLEEFAPGTNWKDGSNIALKRTTRLILVCSTDALVDPLQRKGMDDPVVRELELFSEGDRSKIRIDIGSIENKIWANSAISKYFDEADLFETDVNKTPSDEILKRIDQGFKLEKRERKRLRVIKGVAATLFSLSILLSVLLYFVYAQYDAAIHNLGVANFNEARHLESQSRKYEAVRSVGKAIGLLEKKFMLLNRDSLIRNDSELYVEAKDLFYTLLNESIRPVNTQFKIHTESRIPASNWAFGGASIYTLSEQGKVLRKNIYTGDQSTIPLSNTALHLKNLDQSDDKLIWIDENSGVHQKDPKSNTDKLIGKLSVSPKRMENFWVAPDAKSIWFLLHSEESEVLTLWRKNFDTESEQKISGQWSRKSSAVFLNNEHFLISSAEPFKSENSATNNWYSVLYSKETHNPVSVLQIEYSGTYGSSGGLPPSVISTNRVNDKPLTAAVGLSDGTIRFISVEDKDLPGRDINEKQNLVQKEVFRTPSSYSGSITSVKMAKQGTQVIGSTDEGVLFIWSGETGRLLNVIQAHDSKIQDVFVIADQVLTIDETGIGRLWKDRPYVVRNALNEEILAVESKGHNVFDVLTGANRVHRLSYEVNRFESENVETVDIDEWIENYNLRKHSDFVSKDSIQELFQEKIGDIITTNDKSYVMISFESGWVEAWSMDSKGRLSQKVWRKPFNGNAESGIYMAVSSDGELLAISGYVDSDEENWMNLFAVSSGEELFRYRGDLVSEFGNDHPVLFSSSNEFLITGLYGFLYSWPVGIENVLKPWKDPSKASR